MGRATERVRKELEKLKKYYGATKCYIEREGRKEEVPCESIPELLREGVAKETVIVCNERLSKCVKAPKDTNIEVIEVKGREVYLIKDEAEDVGRWSKLGYVITGKGEGRTIKTPEAGKIIFIEEVLGEKSDHYRIYVASEGVEE